MQKFKLGQLTMTRGVNDTIADHKQFAKFVLASLDRYRAGDWGEMEQADKNSNEEAVTSGDLRIFAAYEHPSRKEWKIWIITEADRSSTTILFPSDY
jgi:hypothetical protein